MFVTMYTILLLCMLLCVSLTSSVLLFSDFCRFFVVVKPDYFSVSKKMDLTLRKTSS
jgi:hypothetical protein